MNGFYYEEVKRYADMEADFWEALRGKTVMVAGAGGMIGSCLTDCLMYRSRYHADNIKVIALSRDRARLEARFSRFAGSGNLICCAADICDGIQLDERPDYIVHAASDGDPLSFSRRPVEVMKANFAGLDNIFSFAREQGSARVLYVSSGEVYGQSVEGKIFDETFSGYVNHASARSCYPASKRAAEVLCQSYIQEYGMDAVIARPCHIYGPNMKRTDSRAIAQFLFEALAGRDIRMKSSGAQERSMCYVFDCVTALLTILVKGRTGEAYNIAAKDAVISIRQLAECICAAGGVRLRVEIPEEEERRGYNTVAKSILDWQKLYALGWRPGVEIREGLRKTFEIMKKDDSDI